MSGKNAGINEWHAYVHALTSTVIGQKLTRTGVCSKQWAKAVALLAVRIDTLKALAYTSIIFWRKQRVEHDGLLPWVVKTGHRTSTHGSVAFILCLESRATIPYHPIIMVPSVFCYTKSPVKRKLASDMERYERKVEAKKRKVENCDRLAAASSLLALSEDGNGSAYCEPHSGLHTTAALTMADIDKLERENDHLKSENIQLRKECEWLKDENSRLAKETDVLKIDCQS